MSLYKRGGVWWMEFVVRGVRVRESTYTSNKELAIQAERKRRRRMEASVHGIREVSRPTKFSAGAAKWIEENEARWSKSYLAIHRFNLKHLGSAFHPKLLGEISARDIAIYQAKRQKQGASNRTINMEISTLRLMLKRYKLWRAIEEDVHMLPEDEEIGRALGQEEATRLLEACSQSSQPSLYPAVVIYCNTGLRSAELRCALWKQVDFAQAEFQVGKAKTKGGQGRVIPLNASAMAAFSAWKARWPDAKPNDYIFPSEKLVFKGKGAATTGVMTPIELDLSKPLGSWKTAWRTAKSRAKVECRLHDLRHHFLTALSETQTSDSTILAIAGHLSRAMLERYSHVRSTAKRDAVTAIEIRH